MRLCIALSTPPRLRGRSIISALAALARGERPSAATLHHARSKGGCHGQLLQTNVVGP
jgi:hypothetical protein